MKYVSDRRFNLGGGAEILTLGSGLADYAWHKVSDVLVLPILKR